jgi:alkanesulfonate monooxygenase SsuD/methylene tetrahydromethanopterin reductase-like flavin-dependent oxidoreductase (luciferase family)
MKFGLFGGATAQNNDSKAISDSQNYMSFIDYVCEAEDLGFDSVFLVEHHFTGIDQVSASINLLTYLAAKTRRIRLGTAVVVLPWHNPVLLAEQAATLDLLSNGRFDFGIGRGYRDYEFSGFCIPMEEAEERYQECVEILKKALGNKVRFNHHGKRWNYENIVVEPSCIQKPHPPMWLGAHSQKSIEEAARNEFSLLLDQLTAAPEIGERIGWYRKSVEAQGRIYNPYSVAVTRAFHLAYTAEEREACHRARASFILGAQQAALTSAQKQAKEEAAKAAGAARGARLPPTFEGVKAASEVHALIGPPDEIIRRIQELRDNGVEYILMMDVNWSREALRTFAKEIMPQFKEPPRKVAAE